MAKRTIDERNEEIKNQEKRVRKMREERKRLLDAEKAKINVEIIKALKKWNDSLPTPHKWDELPDYFRRQAVTNEAKKNQPQYDSTPAY